MLREKERAMREMNQAEFFPHGGDVYRNEVQCDFSVSVNPLGMPAEARRAFRAAERELGQYPDPENRALKEALSFRYGVPEEEILCGGGASGILAAALLAVRPERILLPVPSFSGYRYAVRAAETASGKAVVTELFRLEEKEGFALNERFLNSLRMARQCPDLMILCNPNNPTGRETEQEILLEILAYCGKNGVRLLVDECFLELLPGGKEKSLIRFLPDHPELMLVGGPTKTFGMPGLRAGWLFCHDREMVRRVSRLLPEWPVSVPAARAAAAALQDPEPWLLKSREFIRRERSFLEKGLRRLGCAIYPGTANFIFFSTEKEIGERLLERGILIRSWNEDVGESGRYYWRISVRRHAENVTLLKVLSEIL